MPAYIGLTIGPIYNTFEKVKSTRALFTSSYLFSYIMRRILEQLLVQGVKPEQILTPSAKDISKIKDPPQAGFYADRLIMLAEDGDFERLLNARKTIVADLAVQIENELSAPDVKTYIEQYLQLYCFESDLKEGRDTFKQINHTLDVLELNKPFPHDEQDLILKFLNKKSEHFIIQDAFGKGKRGRYPSLIEISTRELEHINAGEYNNLVKAAYKASRNAETDVADDEELVKKLKSNRLFQAHFKAYHKYIAIVHADGDGLSKYIASMEGNAASFRQFSDRLLDFSALARKQIADFGGEPVYIGGDDLLFFAPVANRIEGKQKTLFSLIKEIDETFQQVIGEGMENVDIPTISYGIAFTYYKYPLNEARNISHSMLEHNAKDQRQFPGKNAIQFHLQKHSGFFVEAGFQKSTTLHQSFLNLIDQALDEPAFINSVIHRLESLRPIIDRLEMLEGSQKVKNLFDNTFNDSIHNDNRAFIDQIASLVVTLYHEYPPIYHKNREKSKHPLDRLYALLRFIHFLRAKDND